MDGTKHESVIFVMLDDYRRVNSCEALHIFTLIFQKPAYY